jgi:hypothetical protein
VDFGITYFDTDETVDPAELVEDYTNIKHVMVNLD